MSDAMIKGSIGSIAKLQGMSLAQAFVTVKALVAVDVSGSMNDRDAPGKKSRYEAALQQLEILQLENPGEVGVIAFSDQPTFSASGVPEFQGGGTDMLTCLQMLKQADGADIKLVLISDGLPDNPAGTLVFAKTFESPISTIYVGPESSAGREFLLQLALATGGKGVYLEAGELNLLSQNLTKLITDGK